MFVSSVFLMISPNHMIFLLSYFEGSTIILKRKFSASQFWDDCRKNSVTVIQYIGEVMRYLCSTPKVQLFSCFHFYTQSCCYCKTQN